MAKGKNVLLDPAHPGYDEAIPREELSKLIEILRMGMLFPEDGPPRITDARVTVEGRIVRRVPDGIAILASGATPGKLSFAPGVIPGRDGFSFAGGTSGDEGPGGDVYLGAFCVIQGAQQKVKLAALPEVKPEVPDSPRAAAMEEAVEQKLLDELVVAAAARVAYDALRALPRQAAILPAWDELSEAQRHAIEYEARCAFADEKVPVFVELTATGAMRREFFHQVVLATMGATVS